MFVSSSSVFGQELEFNRDIRPILTENCFACHGPDSATREAGLRLDQREAAVEMGAIVPGDPSASAIWERIISDGDDRMPPDSSHKELSDQQKQLIKKWIVSGAEYQAHWAFIAPSKSEPPQVDHSAWSKNPIDQFVLAAMQEKGLTPADEADRNTLARRLALDITGLPPAPELVKAFVEDESADAYEKLVDRLLESPRWGEHRGRYWLDVARYADTHGIHFDNFREMWAYRDWVIDAFNQNQPFDQFTIEQLAGDLLPNPTLDQQVATGFNRCNITTNEGGIIDEEYKVLYARDRTETTAQTWMGVTVGCAVCHDHKFDPLTQREFYELSAFFNNTTQAVRDGNIKDTPPTVFVPNRLDRQRWSQVQAEISQNLDALNKRREEARPQFEQWVKQGAETTVFPPLRSEDLHFNAASQPATIQLPVEINRAKNALTIESVSNDSRFKNAVIENGQKITLPEVGDFEADQAFSYGGWIKFSGNNNSGSLWARMDEANGFRGWDFWCEGGRVAVHLVNSWPNDALKVVTAEPVASDQWHHVFITYDGSRKAAGVDIYVDGKKANVNRPTDSLKESIRTEVPFQLFQRNSTSRVSGLALNDIRIYAAKLNDVEVLELARRDELSNSWQLLNADGGSTASPEQTELVFQWYLDRVDATYQSLKASQQKLNSEAAALRNNGTLAHVMHESNEVAKAYVLNRGEYDQRRDEVGVGTPSMLPELGELPGNRMGLAKWLLRPEHPLTARVTVNRFWQSLFGRGLVETSGDFGLTGTVPTHPKLLDWLAVDFREHHWDVKRFFKQIFMSQTYRQAAIATAEKLEIDPANIWLSRGPRFRMDAEMVRDYMLQVSGLLVEKIGGPSVRPYQPPGVWEAVAMPESNTRNYQQDSGENLYRRSLYTFWKRSAPPASMDIFNAPSREVCTVRRERTNTPLQALVTLNDPQCIEAARVLATELLKQEAFVSTNEENVDHQKLNWISMRVLCRQLTNEELEILNSVLKSMRDHYQTHQDDVNALLEIGESPVADDVDRESLAVWTMMVNQFMNLDETLCK